MFQQSSMRIVSIILFSLVFLGFLYSVTKEFSSPKPLYTAQDNAKLKAKAEERAMKKTLAETVWCEDRSSVKSMELVLSVMYNRAKDKTLLQVFKSAVKPYQFSCLNDPSTIKKQKLNSQDQAMYTKAIALVDKLVEGKFKPVTNATFYYAANKVAKPSYLVSKKLVLVFGHHHFYA